MLVSRTLRKNCLKKKMSYDEKKMWHDKKKKHGSMEIKTIEYISIHTIFFVVNIGHLINNGPPVP